MKVLKKDIKEFVRFKLETSKLWQLKGLLKIYENQTEDEQDSGYTSDNNNIGFTGIDGEILSSFAIQLKRKLNYNNDITKVSLSEKQMLLISKKMKKYWKQIIEVSDKNKLEALTLKFKQNETN